MGQHDTIELWICVWKDKQLSWKAYIRLGHTSGIGLRPTRYENWVHIYSTPHSHTDISLSFVYFSHLFLRLYIFTCSVFYIIRTE